MNLAFRLAAQPAQGAGARLPGSLKVEPRLSRWLRLEADGLARVFPGKVEIGQGIATALAQIVADELDLPFERVRMMPVSTATSPDEGVTSGSLSIQECGGALAQVCAEVRALLVGAAARRWSVGPATLRTHAGAVCAADGRVIDYGELVADIDLDVDASGVARTRGVDERSVVGRPIHRLDLPDKVFGAARFIQDLELPGMVHGRVLRKPSPAARLQAVDPARIMAMPGVIDVIRDGDFVGVVAASERAANAALEALATTAVWRESASLPPCDALGPWLKAQPCETTTVAQSAGTAADVAGTREFSAAYDKPFIAHASIGLSCAVALRSGDTLKLWSHTQGPYNLRADLAIAFGLAPDAVVVEHVEGAGCYGHNPADDVAFDAAKLAASVPGRPVRVLWSRADELSCGPFGPAMRVELSARVDSGGRLCEWSHEVWSNGHSLRPGRAPTPTLLGSWQVDPPAPALLAVNAPLAAGGGADRNAVPGYEVGALRVVSHRVLNMPLRSSALRSLGAFANVFAAESFVDEVARGIGADPLEFRLAHLSDPRARAVLERAASGAGWGTALDGEACGRGLGFARYKNTGAWCAVVAEVEVLAAVRVRRLTIAVDAGTVVNPDGVANQIEGGAIQAVSWTLKESVRFDDTRVVTDSWQEYPILGFREVPQVEVLIIDRPDQPSLGAGEASMGPTAAAIGNAVFDALGVRVRALPITRERIIDSMT